MNNRTRIVNDPADLVPLLRVLNPSAHKKVFSSLLNGWRTEDELREMLQEEIYYSLDMLQKTGLVETKWACPSKGTRHKLNTTLLIRNFVPTSSVRLLTCVTLSVLRSPMTKRCVTWLILWNSR